MDVRTLEAAWNLQERPTEEGNTDAWLPFLVQEHDELVSSARRLVDVCEAEDMGSAALITQELAGALKEHFELEEDQIFPGLRLRLQDSTRVDELIEEHRQGIQTVKTLEHMLQQMFSSDAGPEYVQMAARSALRSTLHLEQEQEIFSSLLR